MSTQTNLRAVAYIRFVRLRRFSCIVTFAEKSGWWVHHARTGVRLTGSRRRAWKHSTENEALVFAKLRLDILGCFLAEIPSKPNGSDQATARK